MWCEEDAQTERCDDKKKSVGFVEHERRKIANAEELHQLTKRSDQGNEVEPSNDVARDKELLQLLRIDAAAAAEVLTAAGPVQ